MVVTSVVLAVATLFVSVAIGTVAHEFAHAAALRCFRVPYAVEWFAGDERSGRFTSLVGGPLASVTPQLDAARIQPWKLRVAAMMPLVLFVPFLAIPAGLVADPLAGGSFVSQLVVIGWLACALPSPQDFSLLWHADRALATAQADAAEPV